MPAEDDYYQEDLKELQSRYPGDRFISYCLPPDQGLGGIKVRYIIRVVSRKHAKEIDARQGKAIIEALQWLRDHPDQHEQPDPSNMEAADDTRK